MHADSSATKKMQPSNSDTGGGMGRTSLSLQRSNQHGETNERTKEVSTRFGGARGCRDEGDRRKFFGAIKSDRDAEAFAIFAGLLAGLAHLAIFHADGKDATAANKLGVHDSRDGGVGDPVVREEARWYDGRDADGGGVLDEKRGDVRVLDGESRNDVERLVAEGIFLKHLEMGESRELDVGVRRLDADI